VVKPKISNISYALGEIKNTYSDASGFEAVTTSKSMRRNPEMWGWGNYFATDDIFSLAQPTVRKTLDESAIEPGEVDLVIFCASAMPLGAPDLKLRTAQLLKSVGVANANLIGLTLGGCATTLNAMIMACDLITAKAYRNVLVVAVEALAAERARFVDFAIYSDVCVSFLVSSGQSAGLEVVASTYKTAIDQILQGTDFKNNSLNQESIKQTVDKAQIRLSDIKKIFANNTFLPVKVLREMTMGFSRNQMDMNNVAAMGHGFSCDSILNYCRHKASKPEDGGYFLLLAEADGHSASVLVKESLG
jgi:3-oxoacyl-[acyl-carrier-protein] synthase-3